MSHSEEPFLPDIPDFPDGPDLALPKPSTQSLLHARVPYRRVSSTGSTPEIQYHVTPPEEDLQMESGDGSGEGESPQPQAPRGLGLSRILSAARHKTRLSDPQRAGSPSEISPISRDISSPLEPKPLNVTSKATEFDDHFDRQSTISSQYSQWSPYAAVSSTETLHPNDANNGSREPRFTENLQSPSGMWTRAPCTNGT